MTNVVRFQNSLMLHLDGEENTSLFPITHLTFPITLPAGEGGSLKEPVDNISGSYGFNGLFSV